MAEQINSVLVVCIDRDDDLGRKAGIQGPVVGKQKNLNAAAKLALRDPGESDANCMFAAVKKFEEVKSFYANVEVATLTGVGKTGFESDKRINEQLDSVLEKFPADAFVLVTDGAEDDQVIPILQSRAKIISKELVVIKQAKEVEGAYYAVKEALRDPLLAKIFFGIPGIVLLVLVLLPNAGSQVVMAGLGALLLLYGFGFWDRISAFFRTFSKSVTSQRTSFPFYLATLLVLSFGVLSAYNQFQASRETNLLIKGVDSAFIALFFAIISIELYLFGRSLDAVHAKRAYTLRRHFLTGTSTLLIWFILDSGKNVFVGKADLGVFLIVTLFSFGLFLIAFKASEVLDVRGKLTKLWVGLPVYDKSGKWVGKVESVAPTKKNLTYTLIKTKEKSTVETNKINYREGRVYLSA